MHFNGFDFQDQEADMNSRGSGREAERKDRGPVETTLLRELVLQRSLGPWPLILTGPRLLCPL